MIPEWDGKIYSLNPREFSLERAQEGEKIFLRDIPDSDLYISMSSEDFADFVGTYINSCEQWSY